MNNQFTKRGRAAGTLIALLVFFAPVQAASFQRQVADGKSSSGIPCHTWSHGLHYWIMFYPLTGRVFVLTTQKSTWAGQSGLWISEKALQMCREMAPKSLQGFELGRQLEIEGVRYREVISKHPIRRGDIWAPATKRNFNPTCVSQK